METPKSLIKPWVMWLMPLMFFTYQFILRLWPGLTMHHIMQQYDIDVMAFGFLSAMYYLGYAGMQIPVAMMLDRVNMRYVIAAFTILLGLSAFIFTYSQHWLWALIGRFLIGFASAAGFLGTSKAVSLWFPEQHYARMIGFTFSIGLLGAVYGGQPLNSLINHYGYMDAAQIIALGAILIGVVILLFYRHPHDNNFAKSLPPSSSIKLRNIRKILWQRSIILLALANMLMVGALEGFTDIWGITFLVKAYSMPQDTAAGIISYVYIGMLFGGPVLAFFSERFNNLQVIACCGLSLTIIFVLILTFNEKFDLSLLKVMFFAVGILCCYQVIVFSTCADYVDAKLLGVTIAFMNTINMLGGFFFHTVIGLIAKSCWDGQTVGGCAIYSSKTYSYALMIVPICAFLGSIIVLRAKKLRG